jgi:hypothetical protein
MDADGDRITWDEAEALFFLLFDELPLKQLERSNNKMASPSEAAVLDLSQQQSAAPIVDANFYDQMITHDEFVGFLGTVKAFGYSEKEILRRLSSALEGGRWKLWTAQVHLPAWTAPLQLTTPSRREPTPTPSAPLPDSPSTAVLPRRFQELADSELDQSGSDEDELDESVARKWCQIIDSADSWSATPRLYILSPE